MSVASFIAQMTPYAQREAAITGLDCRLFLVQWAHESGWGSSPLGQNNNMAGITCAPCLGGGWCGGGRFCYFPSLDGFLTTYDHFIHNGNYGGVLAAAGRSLTEQMVALGTSPWDFGHYRGNCGSNGCALINLYQGQQGAFDAAGCGVGPGPLPPPPPVNQCPPGSTWDGALCQGDPTCPPGFTLTDGSCLPPQGPPIVLPPGTPSPASAAGGFLPTAIGIAAASVAVWWARSHRGSLGRGSGDGGGGFGSRPADAVARRQAPRVAAPVIAHAEVFGG